MPWVAYMLPEVKVLFKVSSLSRKTIHVEVLQSLKVSHEALYIQVLHESLQVFVGRCRGAL